MSETSQRLKVLMIHGYRQNATSCRKKSGAFRQLTKKYIEPTFVSAPMTVPPQPADDAAGQDERGWWFSAEDDSFSATQPTAVCRGFEVGLAAVSQAVRQHGPFDGLLGFSQGAALVGILCALQQRQELDWRFSFAVLVAGFRSRSEPHLQYYEESISLPTLHVFGDNDRVIPGELSEDLLKCYTDATVLTHPGGHYIPASARERPAYISFLDRVRAS